MINYYPTLIRHWLGFYLIGFIGSYFSNLLLTPRGIHIPAEVFFGVGLVYFISVCFFQCPRCGKHIFRKGEKDTRSEKSFSYIPDATCPRCLRTRLGVKKFQYIFKPEPWDGVCHDEL